MWQAAKEHVIDVRKAHLVPKCTQDVYVDLPREAEARSGECGKLLYWLYGCRPAGQAWEDHYALVLTQAGFRRGVSSPVMFYHPTRELWCVVHGDDFVFTGFQEDLDFALGIMKRNTRSRTVEPLDQAKEMSKRLTFLLGC